MDMDFWITIGTIAVGLTSFGLGIKWGLDRLQRGIDYMLKRVDEHHEAHLKALESMEARMSKEHEGLMASIRDFRQEIHTRITESDTRHEDTHDRMVRDIKDELKEK